LGTFNSTSGATITGMVNEDSINGTITFYINGQSVVYTFNGRVMSSKDKQEIGMR
jgi:hypothetical protein